MLFNSHLSVTSKGIRSKTTIFPSLDILQGSVFSLTWLSTFFLNALLMLVTWLLLWRHKYSIKFSLLFSIMQRHDSYCLEPTVDVVLVAIPCDCCICFFTNSIWRLFVLFWKMYLSFCMCHIFVYSIVAFATAFVIMMYFFFQNRCSCQKPSCYRVDC